MLNRQWQIDQEPVWVKPATLLTSLILSLSFMEVEESYDTWYQSGSFSLLSLLSLKKGQWFSQPA
jgi:hypothetical protein